MHPRVEQLQHITRRHFFKESNVGLGAIALGSMLARDSTASPRPSGPTLSFNRSPEWYGWLSVTGVLFPNGARSRWLPAAAQVGVQAPTAWMCTACLPGVSPRTEMNTSTVLTASAEGTSNSCAGPTTRLASAQRGGSPSPGDVVGGGRRRQDEAGEERRHAGGSSIEGHVEPPSVGDKRTDLSEG